MQKFGFVFPGQGSQKLGMLGDLAANYPAITDTFDEASAVINQDLWQIAQSDPDNLIDQTHITQPLLLTASIAIWRIWKQLQGPVPAVLAGHSLGEYSALVCGGVLEFTDAVNLVHQRGQFMQSAVPAGTGKMAAIVGLDDELIEKACQQAAEGQVVSPANFNSPGQTVIAGEGAAVERAMVLCKEAGAKRALPLNVSVPSHCALMKPAADQLAQVLKNTRFSPAVIPVVQNVNAEISSNPEAIQQNLIRQLYEPVQWVSSIRAINRDGVNQLVECGPGKVLCGLIKRIDSEMTCLASDDHESLTTAMTAMAV